ncbi:MAG: 3-isopropylmalate dehydratase large subunit [Proteobacteria bacterium]|nr:3-isopropylmalate dehydratase large subunit [Pseudomonadota bacterium]
MGQTIVEKIISNHAGKDVYQDELAVVNVDGAMASDTTSPLTIKSFQAMGGKTLWDPKKVSIVMDHGSPAPNERIANLHVMMRDFAREQGCKLYDIGEGICHQLMIENRHVKPGDIFIGADSHTCTYGAIGAFSTGVGATDLAAVWLTGKIWMRVPKTIKVEISGQMQSGVTAKDLILALLDKTGIAGATYQSMELTGDGVSGLTLASRLSMANMFIEAGAKAGFISQEGLELPYPFERIEPDPDATYVETISIDASKVTPMVSLPPSPAKARPVDEVEGQQIQAAFIGSCVNGRLEDFHVAAEVLKGKKVHPDVRLIMAPASQNVFLEAVKDGTVATLIESGAVFLPAGCGPCVGTHNGVPGDGEVVISTANRNFKGRMGNPNALIYLAAPSTVAASAIEGKIVNPLPYMDN